MMNHSGSWSLEISHNSLASIPSLAFSGLERALWRLVLSHNQFSRVPSDSISRLEKLNFLDLSGNNNFLEESGRRTFEVFPPTTAERDLATDFAGIKFPHGDGFSFESNKYSSHFYEKCFDGNGTVVVSC